MTQQTIGRVICGNNSSGRDHAHAIWVSYKLRDAGVWNGEKDIVIHNANQLCADLQLGTVKLSDLVRGQHYDFLLEDGLTIEGVEKEATEHTLTLNTDGTGTMDDQPFDLLGESAQEKLNGPIAMNGAPTARVYKLDRVDAAGFHDYDTADGVVLGYDSDLVDDEIKQEAEDLEHAALVAAQQDEGIKDGVFNAEGFHYVPGNANAGVWTRGYIDEDESENTGFFSCFAIADADGDQESESDDAGPFETR